MTQLTIQGCIDALTAQIAATHPDERDKLLVKLPLGIAAFTNAKPDDPNGLLLELAGRKVAATQALVWFRNVIGNGDVGQRMKFPGLGGLTSHEMQPGTLVYTRGPGRTVPTEMDVEKMGSDPDGNPVVSTVREVVGVFEADPIVPLEAL